MVLASFNTWTPAASRTFRAESVKKRLAPGHPGATFRGGTGMKTTGFDSVRRLASFDGKMVSVQIFQKTNHLPPPGKIPAANLRRKTIAEAK